MNNFEGNVQVQYKLLGLDQDEECGRWSGEDFRDLSMLARH